MQGDYFGELAVLIQESPGLMLKRSRSAYSITNTVVLYSLNWADLQTLRQMSPQIEETISRAVQKLRRNQPSLFVSVASGTAVRKGDSEVGLEDKVDKLDQKVDVRRCSLAAARACHRARARVFSLNPWRTQRCNLAVLCYEVYCGGAHGRLWRLRSRT